MKDAKCSVCSERFGLHKASDDSCPKPKGSQGSSLWQDTKFKVEGEQNGNLLHSKKDS